MISLSNYIEEGIFDDDDIRMDKIDSSVTLFNYFKKFTEPNTFKDAYIELEQYIRKKCRKVTVSNMVNVHNYIAFTQRDTHGWFDHDNIHSINYIFGQHPKRGFGRYALALRISTEDNIPGEKMKLESVYSESSNDANRILPRKSKYFQYNARAIYELNDETEWVYELFKMCDEKITGRKWKD